MDKKIERMKNLISILDKAASVYYQGTDEIMSNYEYDRLYDELVSLEKETGLTLSGSPTSKVGYEVMSELPKENHGYPILSLDKTKDVDTLASWLGNHKGVLSWKLDGLTVVVTYEEGKLIKAVTRGNGTVGEVITNNAKTFVNIPLTIPYKERIIIRGEALIRYSDFERINASIENPDEKYKNPRNLCSGSVRQLSNEVTASRNVFFLVYNVIDSGMKFTYKSEELLWLHKQGFDVVGHDIVDRESISDIITRYSEQIKHNDFPSDGLVLTYDDIEYGNSLGSTSKFPRHSIAFKWADETAKTKLIKIEWSPSRTGLINPVAIFDPVELEGTTVSRASVHNVSTVEALELGVGDSILVYKANMIIPQIADNLTRSNNILIPDICPVCNHSTKINDDKGIKTLICPNPDCSAKQIKSFTHFVSRDAMNIDGLSEATIEKFIDDNILNELTDFYCLSDHREIIINMDGMGEKSYNKLIEAIDNSRHVNPANFIYSLGIPGIGLSNANVICKHYNYDMEDIINAEFEELISIDGIGEVLANDWVKYMSNEHNRRIIEKLMEYLDITVPKSNESDNSLKGITVVITGSLNMFPNRNALKKAIEDKGGKVTGSVTGNTTYLINNDINSSSSKNKKAKELGVSIITEADFSSMFNLITSV